MRALRWAFALLCLAPAATADGITLLPYAPLAYRLDGHLRFDALPERAEPGHRLDALYVGDGVRVGQHLMGQSIGTRRTPDTTGPKHKGHDTLIQARPTVPLILQPGARGQNLSVALHRGFGSMALFPLGPAGFPDHAARGEGAATFLFDMDQEELGLRLHSDYPSPLGKSPKPGALHVTCVTRKGDIAGQVDIPLATGVTAIGLRFNQRLAAACTLTNTDPGGIAIDDVLYRLQALTG